MRIIIVIVASVFCHLLHAQSSLKKFPINAPFSIFHERSMIFNDNFSNDIQLTEAFVDTKILNRDQLAIALKYSKISEYPDAINSVDKLLNMDKSKVWMYKTYWIGSWTEFFPELSSFRQMHLIWIPKDENQNLENSYVPKTDNGFYVVTRSMSLDTLPFLPASQSVNASIIKKLTERKLELAEPISDPYNMIMPNYGFAMGGFYSELITKFNFTNAELDAVSRSSAINAWPDSLRLTKRQDLALPKVNNYKYYKVGEFIGEYGVNALFWVHPDQSFELGFKPRTELGFFFVAKTDKSRKGRPVLENEDLAFLNSVWWLKNVNTNSYDALTFKFHSSSGAVASTGSSSPSQAGSGGFTVTNVNGITIATGNLERRNKRKGVFIIYWGTGGKAKHCTSFFSEFDAKEEEVAVIKFYTKNYSDGTPFMAYSFYEGEDCQSSRVRNIISSLKCAGCGRY